MRRFKSRMVRIAKFILATLLALAVIDGITTVILGRKVETEILKIRNSKAPIALADLGKGMPERSKNSAVIYEQIFKRWYGIDSDYKNEGFDIAYEEAVKSGKKCINRSGYNHHRFSALSPEKRKSDPQAWTDAIEISRESEADRAMAELASSRPESRFYVKWSDGFSSLLPHLACMRTLARLFANQALVDARNGKTKDSLHSVEMTFRIAESLRNEPGAISQLVRFAVIDMASQALVDVGQMCDISLADAKQLYDYLGTINLRPGMTWALNGERPAVLAVYSSIRHGSGITGGPVSNQGMVAGLTTIARPFIYADELRFLRNASTMMNCSEMSCRSYMQAHLVKKMVPDQPGMSLANAMIPAMSRVVTTTWMRTAQISGDRIFLALAAFKNHYGAYPGTLAELKSRLGWEIPMDPFSENAYVYKPKADGFVLYSLGPDMKDDGGDDKGIKKYERQGDIVWKIER